VVARPSQERRSRQPADGLSSSPGDPQAERRLELAPWRHPEWVRLHAGTTARVTNAT
jgi:hypothetical protein